jgi:drug/metabolite transporter (DMT)-like permease
LLAGSVIIFTGLLAVAFLRARLRGYQWLGMGLVTAGLVIVGLSDIAFNGVTEDTNAIITGLYVYNDNKLRKKNEKLDFIAFNKFIKIIQ